MALGCPVAVANNYAMPEQVGDAGMTFDPRSVNELADVIKILWTDDAVCRELSRRGLERSKLWTQEHFNRNLEQIVSTILYAARAT
jgi:glycosyltransferase involved in cell wall biosynthesis